jgi:hypothetical protein
MLVWYVNVEDAAHIHIAALLDPKLESERIFAMAAPFNWTDVVEIMRKLQPDNDKIPDPPANEGRNLHRFVGEKPNKFCGTSVVGLGGHHWKNVSLRVYRLSSRQIFCIYPRRELVCLS